MHPQKAWGQAIALAQIWRHCISGALGSEGVKVQWLVLRCGVSNELFYVWLNRCSWLDIINDVWQMCKHRFPHLRVILPLITNAVTFLYPRLLPLQHSCCHCNKGIHIQRALRLPCILQMTKMGWMARLKSTVV